MRDRLIEKLTETFDEQYEKRMLITPQHTADSLLADGWMRPPCKVGNKIYYIPFGNRIIECIVARIAIEPFAEIGMSFYCYGGFNFDMRDIGKTVFLTREEAERALKGGEG